MTIGWLRPARYVLLFAMFLPACLFSQRATTGQDVAAPTQVIVVLYTPIEADVLSAYHSDPANKKVQTWEQYWGWVQTFYRGNILSEGWTKFSQVTLDAVKSEAERLPVKKTLNELGKIISQEWAKDASVRKINTTDLRRWNETISAARRVDGGSGQHLMSVMKSIRDELRQHKGR
jgi:hypothetical protein